MKKKLAALLCLFVCAGCVQAPLYETDPEVYRQYKYWKTGENNWSESDGFNVMTLREDNGDLHVLTLIPQKKGVPSFDAGYVGAAQKTAFAIMNSACNNGSYRVLSSQGKKAVDRFFYENPDRSVGVVFTCDAGKPDSDYLWAEQKKWSLAVRRWDKINGVEAYVDSLDFDRDGIAQIRIRLFGGNVSENRRLARRVISDVCPNSNFRILLEKAGVDIIPKGRFPDVVSDENVRVYTYTCHP